MVCIACAGSGVPLCHDCSVGLGASANRTVGDVVVAPAFAHVGTGVRLVHNLKYRRSIAAGRLLAAEMARRVPLDAGALVPVPRVFVRRLVYGIDQTAVLAACIARVTGLPVVSALGAPVWQPRLAGTSRQRRRPPAFTVKQRPLRAVLVDDVLTTGTTIEAAVSALGSSNIVGAVVATSASQPERTRSQDRDSPSPRYCDPVTTDSAPTSGFSS
jgi:predicted amidophosphoribosyltransferase